MQLYFGIFDAPAILGEAYPRDMDVLVDVRLRGLDAYEIRQFIDDLPVLLQLQPPGVVNRQRYALLGDPAGLFP